MVDKERLIHCLNNWVKKCETDVNANEDFMKGEKMGFMMVLELLESGSFDIKERS